MFINNKAACSSLKLISNIEGKRKGGLMPDFRVVFAAATAAKKKKKSHFFHGACDTPRILICGLSRGGVGSPSLRPIGSSSRAAGVIGSDSE